MTKIFISWGLKPKKQLNEILDFTKNVNDIRKTVPILEIKDVHNTTTNKP